MDILADAGLNGFKPACTPTIKKIQLCPDKGVILADLKRYKRLVGRVLYLNFTKPYITYVVQQLSQYLHAPTNLHWKDVVHMLKYFKGNHSKVLLLKKSSSPITINAYSDLDWANCTDTIRSLTRYCIFFWDLLEI